LAAKNTSSCSREDNATGRWGIIKNKKAKLVSRSFYFQFSIRAGVWLRHIVFALFVHVVSFTHVVVECPDVGQRNIAVRTEAFACLTVDRSNMPSRILPVGKGFLALNANYPRTRIFLEDFQKGFNITCNEISQYNGSL